MKEVIPMKWLTKEQLFNLEFKYTNEISQPWLIGHLIKTQEMNDEVGFKNLWKAMTRTSFYLFSDEFKEDFKEFLDWDYLEKINTDPKMQQIMQTLRKMSKKGVI